MSWSEKEKEREQKKMSEEKEEQMSEPHERDLFGGDAWPPLWAFEMYRIILEF